MPMAPAKSKALRSAHRLTIWADGNRYREFFFF
uniref:Uncharacterized protein n=1 Tax=Arundo donax TaxID=35708 RepID=A0A0A9AH93_ARUDO